MYLVNSKELKFQRKLACFRSSETSLGDVKCFCVPFILDQTDQQTVDEKSPPCDSRNVGCDENCLNRMLYIECSDACLLRDHCSNKQFKRGQISTLETFKTVKKGWGLRSSAAIERGSFIVEFLGDVIREENVKQKFKEYRKEGLKHQYMMSLKSGQVVDATKNGSLSRFINHSCQPNCEVQKVTEQNNFCYFTPP